MLIALILIFISNARASIPSFYQVSPTLFRGGVPTEEVDYKALAARGIRTVISLQGGDALVAPALFLVAPGERPEYISRERALVTRYGMRFRNYPMTSILPVEGRTAQSIEEVLADINDPALQPVFVHCRYGRDRTGLVVFLDLVLNHGWSVEAAKLDWIAKGHSGLSGFATRALDSYPDYRLGPLFKPPVSERSLSRRKACRDAFSP